MLSPRARAVERPYRMLLYAALSTVVVSVLLPVTSAQASITCVPSVTDVAEAEAMARACGTRVELESRRSETGRVWANPDGTATIEEAGYPQRVRQADGSWASLDPTLRRNADGSWSPRASLVEMKLSGGGRSELLRGKRAGHELGLSWPGALPEPTVSGSVATYANVLPDVDLVVTASETGFSEVFVVKSPAAARNPKLRKLAFSTRLSPGLRWKTDGGLHAVDRSGRTIMGASDPVMWDSSGDGTSSAARPGRGARVAPITLGLKGSELTLTPDAGLLSDAKAKFPLYVDPAIDDTAWTMINKKYPDQSYWSYDKGPCNGYSTECAKVGYSSTDAVTYRSTWRFPTAEFHGRIVVTAQFTIDLLHSWGCSGTTTELRKTGSISSSTDWNNHASTWAGVTATVSNQSCNSSRKLTEFEGSLKSALQTVANGSDTYTYWGLKAASESDTNAWKTFDGRTAKLIITTNRLPAAPSGMTVDGKLCETGGIYTPTATPTVRAKFNDPDGNSMTGYFEWAPVLGDGTYGPVSAPLSQTGLPHGTYGQVTLPSLVDGRYAVRAWAKDNGNVTGPKTAWCEFDVDTVDPGVPQVSGDVYRPGCPGGLCGSPGVAGRFTFTVTDTDVTSFLWGFSNPPSTSVPATDGTATVDWTPDRSGSHTLHVFAVDRAGNKTQALPHEFVVAQPSIAIGRWRMDDATTATTLADETGHGNTLTVRGAAPGAAGRILPGADGRTRSAVKFDGVDDSADRASLLDTGKSFAVAAWVRLGGKGTVDQTVVSQQGSEWSSFYLQFDAETDRWAFTLPSSDLTTPAPTWWAARSTVAPKVGAWTHLAVVYDSAAHAAYLYVNGVVEGTASGVTAWPAAGDFRVGRSGSTWFNGDIAEVQAWGRAILPGEVFALYDPVRSLVGQWDLGEVGPGPSWDSSELAHDLNFYPQPGGPQIPASGAGHTGTGMRLDGVDDHAAADTAGPVVDTSQSFTAMAWVYIDPAADLAAKARTALAQNGSKAGAFFLGYRNVSGVVRWSFTMTSADLDSPGPWWDAYSATAVSTSDKGRWVHLAATYEAGSGAMRLYVNGALAGSATRTNPSWKAGGFLTVGAAKHQGNLVDHWWGNLDEIRVYQGVLPLNLALHRAATGSAPCDAGTAAEKAVNGKWSGPADGWCSAAADKWLQTDLGAGHTLSSVVVRHAGGAATTRDFTVQVSSDGAQWTTVATVTGNTTAVTTHRFAPTSARHVRLVITTPASDGSTTARVLELEVS